MNALDQRLFYWINGWPEQLAPLMRFFSQGLELWPIRIALGAVLIAMLLRPETRRAALLAGFLWPLANLASDLLKSLFPLPRPCQELPEAVARIGCGQSMGTVSAHAANMMFVATVFLYHFRWKGSPWLFLALLVGVSRVYVGAHFPSQVLFGWLTGGLLAWACSALVAYVAEQAKSKSPPHCPAEEAPP